MDVMDQTFKKIEDRAGDATYTTTNTPQTHKVPRKGIEEGTRARKQKRAIALERPVPNVTWVLTWLRGVQAPIFNIFPTRHTI